MTGLAVSCHVQRFVEWWYNGFSFFFFSVSPFIHPWAEFRCPFVGLVLETQLISAFHGVACQRIRAKHCVCMHAPVHVCTHLFNKCCQLLRFYSISLGKRLWTHESKRKVTHSIWFVALRTRCPVFNILILNNFGCSHICICPFISEQTIW
jgi:hypothetical protein